MKRPFAELWGTGSYAPKRVMTNDEFSKILDTSDQWIQERTGIRERRVSTKEETNACMGKAAALQVLAETGLTPLDIDAIIYATASPDRLLPSQACDLQAILGAKNAAAFDVGAACSGFIYALTTAEGIIAAEQAEHVLVIAAEKLTSIMDWNEFRQRARNGNIVVWGKIWENGTWDPIPAEYWAHHWVEPTELMREKPERLVSDAATPEGKNGPFYKYLKVSRSQIEDRWPPQEKV